MTCIALLKQKRLEDKDVNVYMERLKTNMCWNVTNSTIVSTLQCFFAASTRMLAKNCDPRSSKVVNMAYTKVSVCVFSNKMKAAMHTNMMHANTHTHEIF